MSLQLFGHPFSSYTQKVLIPLWADETPFEYRLLEQDYPENSEILKRHSPFGLFPLILDGDRAVFETSIIIEYLQDHYPGSNRWIPDGDEGLRVRLFDRFFDLYANKGAPAGGAAQESAGTDKQEARGAASQPSSRKDGAA